MSQSDGTDSAMPLLYGMRFPYSMFDRTPESSPGTNLDRAWRAAESFARRTVEKCGMVDPIVGVHCDDEQVWAEVLTPV